MKNTSTWRIDVDEEENYRTFRPSVDKLADVKLGELLETPYIESTTTWPETASVTV